MTDQEIPAARLHAIAAALRAEINREMGSVHFSESTRQIPQEEYVIARHDWGGLNPENAGNR